MIRSVINNFRLKNSFKLLKLFLFIFPILAFMLEFSPSYASSLDREGEYWYALSCPANAIEFNGFENSNEETRYNFSGDCSQDSNNTALPNFPYTIKGTWQKGSKTAVELVESGYGVYTKITVCDFDPWLDPSALCQDSSSSISNNNEPMSYLKAQLDNRGAAPVSAPALADHRNAVLEKVLAQSLRIIGPDNNQTFQNPDSATVIVELDYVVSRNQFPPNLVVVLKGKETIWPDPNLEPRSPRSFDLAKNITLGAKSPIVYFPLGGQDVWGGRWQVQAHLLVADPFWSSAIYFSVVSHQTLANPVEPQKKIEIVKPQDHQNISGDVVVKVDLQGFSADSQAGGPDIILDWWWNPPSAPGAWPETPQQRTVVAKMQGSELVVPRALFSEPGSWRLLATIKLNASQSVSDDVVFTLKKGYSLGSSMKKVSAFKVKTMTPKPFGQKNSTAGMVTEIKPSVRLSLKHSLIPKITSPRENQKFDRAGFIAISAYGAAGAVLVKEVTYKPFKGKRFSRISLPFTKMSPTGNSAVKSLRFKVTKPGYYRFRLKENTPGASWSSWRNFSVGSPMVVKSTPIIKKPKKMISPGAKKSPTIHPTEENSEKTKNKLPLGQKKPSLIMPKPVLKSSSCSSYRFNTFLYFILFNLK